MNIKDALTNLLKVESILSICLMITFCVGCFMVMKQIAPELPEALVDLFGIVIGYFFGQKSGRALAKLEALTQANSVEKD